MLWIIRNVFLMFTQLVKGQSVLGDEAVYAPPCFTLRTQEVDLLVVRKHVLLVSKEKMSQYWRIPLIKTAYQRGRL